MSTQDIEQVILEYIKDISKRVFIGKLGVEKLNPIGYNIKFYIHGRYEPIVIHAELEDEAFLKFIRNEISLKKFHLFDSGVLNKREPTLCYPIDKSCKCNDKRRIN